MEESLIVLVILSVLSIIYIKVAAKFNIIDNPNHRSSHTVPTIRGGGILFYFAVLIFFFLSDFKYPYFTIGISLIAIVSFIDDIVTLSTRIRLPFQLLAVLLVFFEIGIFSFPVITIFLLVFGSVGIINIFNFMDGINGITGIYGLVVLLSFLSINYVENIVDPNLIIFSILSLIVFGYYNFRKKARMFAGDIGSISLAMLILFLGLSFIIKLNAPIILLLIIVFGADGTQTLVYRLSIKENVTDPHRHHMYQKLVDMYKWSHLKVSIFYFSLQLLMSVLVFFTYKKPLYIQFIIMILSTAILVATYYFTLKNHDKKLKQKSIS